MAEEKHYIASDHFDLTGCESIDLYLIGFRAGYEACERKHLEGKYTMTYGDMRRFETQAIELEEQVRKLKKKLKEQR